jgi:hypothetical protein
MKMANTKSQGINSKVRSSYKSDFYNPNGPYPKKTLSKFNMSVEPKKRVKPQQRYNTQSAANSKRSKYSSCTFRNQQVFQDSNFVL